MECAQHHTLNQGLEAAAASNPVIGYKEYETSAALEAMLQQRLEAVSELQTSAGELAWNPVLFEPTLQHLVPGVNAA
eukprot:5311112-Amphidinium_carterae.1